MGGIFPGGGGGNEQIFVRWGGGAPPPFHSVGKTLSYRI